MTKDLVSLQKNNIRILVYATDNTSSINSINTRINIVVGAEDINMDLSEFRQLVDMLEAIEGLV